MLNASLLHPQGSGEVSLPHNIWYRLNKNNRSTATYILVSSTVIPEVGENKKKQALHTVANEPMSFRLRDGAVMIT